MKIILLGNSNIGKSSILYYYEHKKRNFYDTITIGVDKYETNVNITNKNNMKTTIKVQIWDTAGQELYNSIISLYYKYSMGVLLVFDLTNKKSFMDLSKWIKQILNNSDIKREHILLIGNKVDKLEDRVISFDDAHKFMRDNKLCGYIETSAHTGYNINFIFSKLVQEIYNTKDIIEHNYININTKEKWYNKYCCN
jgi:small GTP-binding protein